MAPDSMTSRGVSRSNAWLAGCALAALLAGSGMAHAQAPVAQGRAAPPRAQIEPPPGSIGTGQTRTLADALAITYASNPALLAARAQLRSVDENVPGALAGWRPQISVSNTIGYIEGTTITRNVGVTSRLNQLRGTNTEALNVTQPLYRGGQTRAGTNRAENQVMGQRATLIASEQTAFINAVNAYVGVIQSSQVLALNINNEQVLGRQLQATRDRFRVGEITRTDVAQAEAALAGATATRQTAEGNLATARATYVQTIGEDPGRLIEPQPLRSPTKTLEEAKSLATTNNPNVVAALFNDASAKDNFDLQYSKLMPNVSLQGQLARNEDSVQKGTTTKIGQILASITIPIYQGGAEYAAIRQARQQQQQTRKQVDDQRRTAEQLVTSAWQTNQSVRATIESTRQQIRSNEIALEGVQREAIVGSRTTLDVLNAEQTLLISRVTLVQNLASLVNATYQVASAAGRLTARDLNLNVPLYDEKAYYNAVRDRWIGTGDYAIDQPGR
jgi:outer membrane protein